MKNLIVVDHPLVQHKLTLLRKKDTSSKEFRNLVAEISTLLAYEATRDLPLENIQIETPVTEATGKIVSGLKQVVVPVLRTGLGLVDGMLSLLPAAKVGHIGIYRDEETREAVNYYTKLPKDMPDREVYITDAVLATGTTAIEAVNQIKATTPKRIKFICLLASPEGIEAFSKAHPDVTIITAAVDFGLADGRYISPGMGDAGDRFFGTL
jgi:uracil phosphoribosyltransferase